MKKITLLFILCVGFTFNSHAQLPETFDTEIPATWAVFSGLNEEGPTYTWVHSNGYGLQILMIERMQIRCMNL
jgi:hypothetical protein